MEESMERSQEEGQFNEDASYLEQSQIPDNTVHVEDGDEEQPENSQLENS